MKSDKINYCALTTIAGSLKSFVMPSAIFLSNNGYDVTVGCRSDDEISTIIPVNIKYIPLSISRGYSVKSTIKATRELYRFFKRENIQMVEYGTENISFCASIAAWAAKVPIRIYNHWGARYVGFTGLSRQLSFLLEKTIARLSTTIRQQSPLNMQICINDGLYSKDKVKVLGYGGTVGADFSKFDISHKAEWNSAFRKEHNIPMDDIVFGDVAAIRKDKGHDELIAAFRKLNNRNAWLVFVGSVFAPDAPSSELMDWAKDSDRVIFTGRVNDVEHYVSAFDCIVHPSYREGLGMVLQEAGAVGVPYIACNIPGPGEIGIDGETGILVEKGNVEDLFNKMQYLINDRHKLKEMSVNMYKLTKARYERSVMLQRILDDRNELRRLLG